MWNRTRHRKLSRNDNTVGRKSGIENWVGKHLHFPFPVLQSLRQMLLRIVFVKVGPRAVPHRFPDDYNLRRGVSCLAHIHLAVAVWVVRGFFDCPKAFALWLWFNFASAAALLGTSLLRINLDETAICLWQGMRKVNIFGPSGAAAIENVSLQRRRTYMTLIATICDNPLI